MSTIDELALEIAELHAHVQLTEDTLAIYDLKSRYGELVDQRYSRGNVVEDERLGAICEEIAKLFSVDATWDGGPTLGRVVGRDAICHQMRQTTLLFSRHLFVKPGSRSTVTERRAAGTFCVPVRQPTGSLSGCVGMKTTSTSVPGTLFGCTRA